MKNKSKIIIISLFLSILCLFGAVFTASAKDKVYVDINSDYSGTPTGSYDKPFTNIQAAIHRANSENKEVYILPGTYFEHSISVWRDVKIKGSDKDKVIIQSPDNDKSVFIAYSNTLFSNLTIKNGRHGIYVLSGNGTTIWKCNITNNNHHGIYAKKANLWDSRKISIYYSQISNNGWNGLYSEMRKLFIKEVEFENNGHDGADLGRYSIASIRNSRFADNNWTGLRIRSDGGLFTLRDNTFRDNDNNGLEIRMKYGPGQVYIKDECKFYQNDEYGILKIQESPISQSIWDKNVVIDEDTRFWENEKESISSLITL